MSLEKKAILEKLRRGGALRPVPVELDRSDIACHDWTLDEKVTRFTERMVAVRAEVIETDSHSWLDAVETLCQKKGLKNLLLDPKGEWGAQVSKRAARSDALPTLMNFEHSIDDWKDELFNEVDASLTGTRGGIAETGTLILWATEAEPRTMSLVPPIHIALLKADELYSTFAEAMRDQRWAAGLPTNALLISGPSKSADIEQTLAYGVHGPKELIVLLIRD